MAYFNSLVKRVSEIDSNGYPESMGQTFIVNTPSTFPFVWRGIKVSSSSIIFKRS